MSRAALSLFLLAAVVVGCGGKKRTDRPGKRPSVLLVTIDTMRPDFVGPGHPTPALNRFLKTATRFEGARTPVPLTLPSHLAMLSGLAPVHSGIHDNASVKLPLDRGYPLLAEEFRNAGYATGGFVSCAVVGPGTGINAGFQTFESPHFGPLWSGDPGDVPGEKRIESPLAWLSGLEKDRPYFLWVHLFDPHAPYRPFDGDSERPATHAGEPDRALYAGEISRADAAFGRLLEAVGKQTIVVVASDHGESLGEHKEPTHGNLCYSATVDVFLAARAPELQAGAVDTSLRSLCDISVSLRRWCGLPKERSDGLPLDGPPHSVVVTESLLSWRTHGWGQVFAACDGRFTLVETGPRVELFDRKHDPAEVRPLDLRGNPAYEELDRALSNLRAEGKGGAEGGPLEQTASPYGSARLPESTYLSRAENAKLKDPASGFAFRQAIFDAEHDLYRAQVAGNAAGVRAVVKSLESLAKEDATSPAAYGLLADAEGLLGDMTNDPAEHRRASAAALESMRRGYQVAPLLARFLAESLAAGKDGDFRAALEEAAKSRAVADVNCAELVEKIARRLKTAHARKEAQAFLRRTKAHLKDPKDLRRIEDLEEELGS